jgi:hypothetical protein
MAPVVGRITSNSIQEDLDWLVKRVVNGAVVDLEKVIKDVNNCLLQATRECVLIAAAVFVIFGIPIATFIYVSSSARTTIACRFSRRRVAGADSKARSSAALSASPFGYLGTEEDGDAEAAFSVLDSAVAGTGPCRLSVRDCACEDDESSQQQ